MALNFQYNKTSQQALQRGLKVRENALPTLQAKESALRLEVKKAREQKAAVDAQVQAIEERASATFRLWTEFPHGLVTVRDVHLGVKKIAGVKTPTFQGAIFDVRPYSVHSAPSWIPGGIELLKDMTARHIERAVAERKVTILEWARKKTTQKVNLYEKVQIPEYREAIRRIKRFLEDDENLAKSSQKILKTKIAAAEAA